MHRLKPEEARKLVAELEEKGINRTQASIMVEAAGDLAIVAYETVVSSKAIIARRYKGRKSNSTCLIRRYLLVALVGVAYRYEGNGKGFGDYKRILSANGIRLPSNVKSADFAPFVAAMIQCLEGEPSAVRVILSHS